MPAYALLAFSLAGSLFAFLIFNYNPAKIFMGDCGSLLLGLVNAILAIKFVAIADTAAVSLPIESCVAVGIAVLIVPLMDTLRVFSIRILKGRSPFSPDRNHIHHLLLDRGFNHKYVTLCCLLLNILFITVAYFGRSLGPTYLLFSMLGVAVTVLGIIIYSIKPIQGTMVSATPITASAKTISAQPTVKVVSINAETATAVEQ
jgi:UDP-N-acetylmuramyl pentapeptide phosphotransferase/UDP-N-acetylglucosamine-1-phosphate transferase